MENVAPPAGAWIEICQVMYGGALRAVAPPAGAWIEIPIRILLLKQSTSLPPRERGLKFL